MYVMPFWSYRASDDHYVFTNHLTKRTGIAPARTLDVLEAVHGDNAVPAGDDVIAWARDLELVVESGDAAEEYLARLELGWQTGLPVIDQIELTNRCPYSCKMCPRTTEMTRSLGDMPIPLLESVLDQIAGRQHYTALHHFGESLVYPQLAAAIGLARERGVRTGLSCNPPSLHPHVAAKMLDAGISNVVLSLDSLDPDVYRGIRGNAARFGAADANLRELVRLRDAGDYPAWITLQMISMDVNRGEADRFLAYCEEVGVDRGVVVRLGRWDFDDAFVQAIGEFTSPSYNGYCSRPWTSVVVMWDGRVVPCCHDYDGKVVLGDLRTATLEEIWSSPATDAFRRRNGEYELCRQCAFSRWYRERQRRIEGFRAFHHERAGNGARKEWLNPASLGRRDELQLFDGFDVLVEDIAYEPA